jgi:hypothetical protein
VKLELAQYKTSTQVKREIEASLGYADWNLPIRHWSPSSLAMLRRCPRQFQQRYILGRKERPGEARVTGSAVHAALERNFEQKIASHEDLPLVDVLEWYLDEGFTEVVDTEQALAGEEVVWNTSPDDARRTAASFCRQTTPPSCIGIASLRSRLAIACPRSTRSESASRPAV